MSQNRNKRGLSIKRRDDVVDESDSPASSIVFGVLGDTFSLGGPRASQFHGHLLAEALVRCEMPAKLLHHLSSSSSAQADVSADVIVVPDVVFTDYEGKLTVSSLGLEARTINSVRKANAHQDTKYIPLSHFFACLSKSEQKQVLSKLDSLLPGNARFSQAAIKSFLGALPSLCLSGQVQYAHKNVSKAQLTSLLDKLGVAHSTGCATEDSVILGDSNQGAKYLDGTNVSVLSMWQFQALQSLKAHEVIGAWFQSVPSASSPSSSAAAASSTKQQPRAIKREVRDDEYDMDDVVPTAKAKASSKATKRGASKKAIRGRAEEEAEEDAATTVSGENETALLWDQIIF